ncbi:hypothetical protein MNBD_NITROSPIRAE01-566 [hydrothermal vent metagenome]|uniref:N-acetyltransferase domain-containing protein n=1 Tax=hydrothermal vent metagenome TaxID=652676 RepID=A0A3B1CDR7_9ZZZZ
MKFEILNTKIHKRKNFDCGVEALNRYLEKYANQDQKRGLTKIYILSEENTIVGYYSLSAHSAMRDNLPEEIKIGGYGDIPFLLLGRLAVDKKHQGQGYGDVLIFHAFKITMEIAEKVGILAMIVDAKNDAVVSFYEGFGFKRLKATETRLVLPITALSKLL